MEREEEDAHPPGTHLAASWRLKYEVSAGIDYYVSTIPGADKRFLEFLSMLKQQSREQSRNAETHGVFSLSLALLCSCCCPLPTKLANYLGRKPPMQEHVVSDTVPVRGGNSLTSTYLGSYLHTLCSQPVPSRRPLGVKRGKEIVGQREDLQEPNPFHS